MHELELKQLYIGHSIDYAVYASGWISEFLLSSYLFSGSSLMLQLLTAVKVISEYSINT